MPQLARVIALCTCLMLFAAIPTSRAEEERLPWDQERVSALARQLAGALAEVRVAARRDPALFNGIRSRNPTHVRLMDSLRRLETSSRQLASSLEAGGGFDETLPIAKRIATRLRDARVAASGLTTTRWTQERVEPAMALVRQIEPFYGKL